MRITHHSNYLRFMEKSPDEFFSEIGFSMTVLEKAGIVSSVVSYR